MSGVRLRSLGARAGRWVPRLARAAAVPPDGVDRPTRTAVGRRACRRIGSRPAPSSTSPAYAPRHALGGCCMNFRRPHRRGAGALIPNDRWELRPNVLRRATAAAIEREVDQRARARIDPHDAGASQSAAPSRAAAAAASEPRSGTAASRAGRRRPMPTADPQIDAIDRPRDPKSLRSGCHVPATGRASRASAPSSGDPTRPHGEDNRREGEHGPHERTARSGEQGESP